MPGVADIRRILLLVLGLGLGLSGNAAAQTQAVVVLGVSGPMGGQAAQMVTRSLAGRYRVVSRGAFVHAARQQNVNYHQPRAEAERRVRCAWPA